MVKAIESLTQMHEELTTHYGSLQNALKKPEKKIEVMKIKQTVSPSLPRSSRAVQLRLDQNATTTTNREALPQGRAESEREGGAQSTPIHKEHETPQLPNRETRRNDTIEKGTILAKQLNRAQITKSNTPEIKK